MYNKTKLAATVIIVAGGALVGALGGWNVSPLRLELAPEQVAMLGAAASGMLALWGCRSAMERADARAQNREVLARLDWQMFKVRETLLAKNGNSVGTDPGSAPPCRVVDRSVRDAKATSKG